TQSPFIWVVATLLAMLTAQSRVEAGVHSLREVLLGALLGITVPVVILYMIPLVVRSLGVAAPVVPAGAAHGTRGGARAVTLDPWLWIRAAPILVALCPQAFFSRLEPARGMARRSRLAPIAGVPEERLRQAEALLDNPEPFQTAAHITTNCCEAVT